MRGSLDFGYNLTNFYPNEIFVPFVLCSSIPKFFGVSFGSSLSKANYFGPSHAPKIKFTNLWAQFSWCTRKSRCNVTVTCSTHGPGCGPSAETPGQVAGHEQKYQISNSSIFLLDACRKNPFPFIYTNRKVK